MQTSASQNASTLPGGDYNAVPYVSTAIVQSQPARLFALAKLFGLTPPAMETASILELGCASGGNIIPLAARFPRARFVGIDLTPRHVDEGQARIRALGLTNIEIQQGDVTTLDLSEGFDCIICHGVYSWVPPAARESILRIAARNLKPDGISYVSYNVFPGWQMRGIIRDLMLFHAGHLGSPHIRIAMARGVLDTVAKMANPGTSYGARLREEAKELATQTDAYILGEFLAPDNAPCYFRDFIAAAERQGLVYLCDTAIEMCLPETHGAEVAKLVREMSGDRLLLMEQYIDFLVGRAFRCTLLVHREQAGCIQRLLQPGMARSLHVSGQLMLDASASSDGRYLFRSPNGRRMTAMGHASRRTIEVLSAAYPATRSLDELCAELSASDPNIDLAGQAEILNLFFQLIITGFGKASSVPVRIGKATVQRPIAWSIARADAAAGLKSTTNAQHEAVALDIVTSELLPHLDGRHTRAMLGEWLMNAVKAGRITMQDNTTNELLSGSALDNSVAEHVEGAIGRLAAAALLEPVQISATLRTR
jgi:SAM-dependent methyltransferase/methyltransferase-like protein